MPLCRDAVGLFHSLDEDHRNVIAKVLDYDLEVSVRIPVVLLCALSDQNPWERYWITLSLSHGLNSTTAVLLPEWLWHWITLKDWGPIKTKETKPICNLSRLAGKYICKVIPKGFLTHLNLISESQQVSYTDVYTATLFPTKPSSDDDSGSRHCFGPKDHYH